ncbi:MAG TPA: HlyD family efflux transporter periplasmic adaptor subunit [Caulobacteraceae bacterium]|nr:HlyD family efflux transporter periplasmic adaptor subunit [Caulobacteraceae bacterium]
MNPQRLVIGGLALAAALVAVILFLVPQFRAAPRLSGYIEGEPLYLASPIAGQLIEVMVARGQRVAAGAPLFVVDTRTLVAARDQATGRVTQAQSAIQGARATRAQLAASVAAAQASAVQADQDLARVERLLAIGGGAISKQDVDKYRAADKTARAQLAAARRQADAAAAQIASAGGQLGEAEGSRADALARLGQASPVAPAPARVEDVFFQAGEWAAANQPVVSLLPDDRVRLRFFVPERSVALYSIGRQVSFGCDGCTKGLVATINYVSPRAEFTPPVIYSLQSRDRLVFLVEALPAKPAGLTPGLPIDVVPLGSAP